MLTRESILEPDAVIHLTGTSAATLTLWRNKHKGPRWVMTPDGPGYPLDTLADWMHTHAGAALQRLNDLVTRADQRGDATVNVALPHEFADCFRYNL